MAIYTGVADANGDFTVPFSSNYTSGQKVTVTAEKDGAEKSISIFAPSSVSGGGFLQFSGNTLNYPNNVGHVTITDEISGALGERVIATWPYATGLTIDGDVTSIGDFGFQGWTSATSLNLPETLTTLGRGVFYNWTSLQSLRIPPSVASIGVQCFYSLSSCNEIICTRGAPPSAQADFLFGLKSTCVIKVPAASLQAYKTAPNWSAHASKMIAI